MHFETRRREFDIAFLGVKLGRQAAACLHAIDATHEIEEPVTAMEFAVGADFQADRLLHGDGVVDRAGLDRP